VYCVTRLDIPSPHRAVQAAHGVLAATLAFGEPSKTHPHLVLCATKDEAELASLFNRLKDQGVPCCAWYESDQPLAGQLTAVATAPLAGAGRLPLRHLPLLPG
jgi:hypothetical protein